MEWSKDILAWRWGRTLHLSVVFTWDLPRARQMAKQHRGPVRAGGPAVDILPGYLADVADVETPLEIPALHLHNPFATRTSRGCPRQCAFCINRDSALELLPDFAPAPLVCDDNFLATPVEHQELAVERLAALPYVDFNQGLDAQRFNQRTVAMMRRLRHARLRFAWDRPEQELAVQWAVEACQHEGLMDLRCYVLIGYPAGHDTPEYARYRCETLRSWGIEMPNVQRFQPVRIDPDRGIHESHLLAKNSYVAPVWTEAALRRHMKYWNRQAWYGGVRFEDFRPAKSLPLFTSDTDHGG